MKNSLLRAYMRLSPLSFGKTRLLRIVNAIAPFAGEVTARTSFGASMRLDLTQFIERHIYFFGAYEPHILEAMGEVSRTAPTRVMVDAGANVGQHSLYAAVQLGAERVFAFEPTATTFARLESNIRLNRLETTITAVPKALSDREGTVTMESPVTGDAGSRFMKAGSTSGTPAITLDRFAAEHAIDQIDLMKCDVEGAEMLILRGAGELLSAHRIRALIVEVCGAHLSRFGATGPGLVDLLLGHGYRGFALGPRGRAPLPSPHPPFFEALFLAPREPMV